MAYIGNTLRTAQPNYQIIDDISASFNGSTTSFALQVGGVTPAPFPVSAQHCLISVGGVIQQPDPTGTDGFLLSGSNIVFSAAPSFGEDFFGVVLAGADYINVGAEFPDGSVANPSITFDSDRDTGLYRKGANNIAITTNGTERVSVGTSEVVFNDGGNDINFRIEGDTEPNLLFVDAGNDRIGIGVSTPDREFHVESSLADTQYQPVARFETSSTGDFGPAIELTGNRNSNVSTAWIGIDSAAAGGSNLVYASDGLHRWLGNDKASERMRVDNDGRLLVGTSSATSSALFHLQGRVGAANEYANMSLRRGSIPTAGSQPLGVVNFTDDSHNVGAQFFAESDGGSWTSGSNHRTRLVFATTADGAASPTERFRISSAGKLTAPGVYSGTTTGGGPVYVESDGDLLRFTSSRKYKTDIETIEDFRADAILNCRPVWYRSLSANDIKTEGAEKSEWGWYGFIAEEVAEIDPRLVNWATKDAVVQEDGSTKSVERDPADYEAEGVRYETFVPLLLNLIKRQQAAIETLEAEKTAQQTQLDDLIARVTALETN